MNQSEQWILDAVLANITTTTRSNVTLQPTDVVFSSSDEDYNSTLNDSHHSDIDYAHRVFEICVTFVAVIGTLANGLVLYILGRSEKQRRATHIFILNQISLDLFSSVSLILTYIWKIVNVRLSGYLSFLLCLLLGSEDILWTGLNGSILNLTFMTIERYLKIVFPIFHRNHYRTWMNYFLMALAWVSGFLMNFPAVWTTTDFTTGECQSYTMYPSVAYGVGVTMYFVLLQFIIPIVTFLFCYGHIIVVIRRSGQMFKEPEKPTQDGQTNEENAVQAKNTRNERSVVKIMATVAGMFTICWTPLNIYFILVNVGSWGYSMNDTAWYASMFFGFITISIQPFIYVYGLKAEAIKNGVFKFLRRRLPGNHSLSQSADVTVQVHM